MSVFFKKTVQHYQNENGIKKTSFSVVKDNHGIIHKINGVGNGDKFNIKETVAKLILRFLIIVVDEARFFYF
jgi:hypothetical protein